MPEAACAKCGAESHPDLLWPCCGRCDCCAGACGCPRDQCDRPDIPDEDLDDGGWFGSVCPNCWYIDGDDYEPPCQPLNLSVSVFEEVAE